MDKNENLKRFEMFFDYDLKAKKLLNDILPNQSDFYSDEGKIKYSDRVMECINDIRLYISRLIVEYNLTDKLLLQFHRKMEELKNFCNSEAFFNLLNQGYDEVLKYLHQICTDMRPEFVESVKKGFIGYSCFYGWDVLEPITINEFLHYVHSYVVNKTDFYCSVPMVRSLNDNDDSYKIALRGTPNEIGNTLYDAILATNLNASIIDIINLDNRMLIMSRDLGHATVIEVDMTEEKVYVKYFIPKNNNQEMVSALKGINVNKKEFATGEFQATKEELVQDLCTLMKGIPTDYDMKISSSRG